MDVHFCSLEPDVMTPKGEPICLVVEILVFNPGAHVCRTKVHRQVIVTDCNLEHGPQWHTLLAVNLDTIQGKRWALATPETVTFAQPQQDLQGLLNIVETCSGLGAVGKGFAACGATTCCFNDHNPEFHKWLQFHTKTPSILGNLVDHSTIQQIRAEIQGAHILSSGISCQPFSRMGDRKEHGDPRSESFPGTLALSYYLGSLAVILECTSEAMESEWVQTTLHRYAAETGHTLSQKILNLHPSWPGKRTRWWAVLAHPALDFGQIPDMPAHRFLPTLTHLVPSLMQLDQSQLEQIKLDEEELLGFSQAKGGITSKVIDMCKPMPTATHSWGSQLKKCHCGCRDKGFHPDRLQERGLHGAIVPLGTDTKVRGVECTEMRHLHPQEIALFSGLQPSHVCPDGVFHLRLLMAGVGQLASPLQGGWILSNLLHRVAALGLIREVPHPREVFTDMCLRLLEERDQMWPENNTVYMKLFEQEIQAIDRPLVYATMDQLNACEPEDDASATNVTTEVLPCTAPCTASPCTEPCTEPPCTAPASSVTEARVYIDPVAIQDTPQLPAESCPVVNADLPASQETPQLPAEFAPVPNASLAHTKVELQPFATDECQATQVIPPSPTASTDVPTKVLTDLAVATDYADHTSEPDSLDIKIAAELKADHLSLDEVAKFETTGAVPGFANKRKLSDSHIETSSTKHHKTDASVLPPLLEAVNIPKPPTCNIHIIDQEHTKLTVTCFTTTICSELSSAQACLANQDQPVITTLVGTPVPSQEQVQADMWYQLQPQDITAGLHVPPLFGETREKLLWQQQGWVAVDEMTFYMQILENYMPSCSCIPTVVEANPAANAQIASQVVRMMNQLKCNMNTDCKCGVFLHQNHWTPIVVRRTPDQVEIWLPTDASWIRTVVEDAIGPSDCTYKFSPITSLFPADCGFQAIGWMISVVLQDDTTVPITPEHASQWRGNFHDNLIYSKHANAVVHVPLMIGGTKLHEQLITLVQEHWVHATRASECASHLIDQLGAGAITNALKSPKPWQDLKSKATMHSPPIKIVQADELQELIRDRVKHNKSIGSKANKVHATKTHEARVSLKADQLQLPRAVFKQEDGTELSQLTPQQVGPTSQGVLLVNIESALPFFQLNQHLSPHGVGLLVIETNDPRIPQNHQVVKLPVIHQQTQEPMIISAALLQLGATKVSRNFPTNCIAVPQVDTKVIRVQVYRDQTTHAWKDFIVKPVRTMSDHPPFLDLAVSDVLDVWDRQFVNHKLSKQTPETASIFIVNLRVTEDAAKILLSNSGTNGQYFEPRSEDGRHPDPNQQVVWLVNKQFTEAQITQRAHANATLVRQGDRYGIRVPAAEAEPLHLSLRPDLVFLPGTELKKFKVGPWPYGSTKQSLTQVFKKWEWQARPVSPAGQTQDRSGVIWNVHAAQEPSHWIFHLQHGDVLITPEDKTKAQVEPRPAVMASSNTIKHLKQPEPKPIHDPWLHKDPWQSTTVPSVNKELSVSQFNALQNQIEERIRSKLQPEDEEMKESTDARVTALETRLEELATTVGKHHVEQQSHNQATHAQLGQLDQKISSQQQGLQNMLESKLDQQLQRIEQMFRKRHGGE